MRCSPLVRISRSGSGMPAVLRHWPKQLLVDRRGVELARLHLARQPARRLGDLASAAIVQRHDDDDPLVVAAQRLGFLDQLADVVGQAGAVADHPQLDAVAAQLVELAAEIDPQADP